MSVSHVKVDAPMSRAALIKFRNNSINLQGKGYECLLRSSLFLLQSLGDIGLSQALVEDGAPASWYLGNHLMQ